MATLGGGQFAYRYVGFPTGGIAVLIVGRSANLSLRCELMVRKYVRRVRKWGHYNGKKEKRGKGTALLGTTDSTV